MASPVSYLNVVDLNDGNLARFAVLRAVAALDTGRLDPVIVHS